MQMLGDNYEFSVIDEHGNSHEFYRHPVYGNYCCSTDSNEIYTTAFYASNRFKFMKQPKDKDGYGRMSVFKDGKRVYFRVNRLIYSCFNDIPEGYVIDHIDHNVENNHLYNLRAVPPSTNGRNLKGTRGIRYNYTETLPEDAIKIEHARGLTFDKLYYSPLNDKYFVDLDVNFRELYVNKNKTICVYDANGNKVRLSLCYIKREYGLH